MPNESTYTTANDRMSEMDFMEWKELRHEVVVSMSKPGAEIACYRLSNDAFNYNS